MAKAAKEKTVYVILASIDGGKTWTMEGTQEATSKASALSHFYENRAIPVDVVDENAVEPVPRHESLFQAIPPSSWKPLKPSDPRPRIPFSEVA